MRLVEKQSKSIKGGKRSGAGRKAGVPNKRTQEVQDAVEESGITPLEYMLSVMRSEAPDTDDPVVLMRHVEARMDAAKAAAPYVHAKLASIEHTGEGGGAIALAVNVNFD